MILKCMVVSKSTTGQHHQTMVDDAVCAVTIDVGVNPASCHAHAEIDSAGNGSEFRLDPTSNQRTDAVLA